MERRSLRHHGGLHLPGWLLLTKRPENVPAMVPAHWLEHWPPHVWLGTTAETQERYEERIVHLLSVPAHVKYLSLEALLGPVDVSASLGVRHEDELGDAGILVTNPNQSSPRAQGVPFHDPWVSGVMWVIVGGESGRRARPMNPHWVRHVRDACSSTGTHFFFKQWGRWAPDPSVVTTGYGTTPEFAGSIRWWVCQSSTDRKEVGRERPVAYDDQGVSTPLYPRSKKQAGRLLDGVEWSQVPTTSQTLLQEWLTWRSRAIEK